MALLKKSYVVSDMLIVLQGVRLDPNRMSIRYAIALHRIKDAERSLHPTEQLSWAANEMASILREGDPTLIELRIAWAGLAMVHKAQHEIATTFEDEQKNLSEVEERALYTLKQVNFMYFHIHIFCSLLRISLMHILLHQDMESIMMYNSLQLVPMVQWSKLWRHFFSYVPQCIVNVISSGSPYFIFSVVPYIFLDLSS